MELLAERGIDTRPFFHPLSSIPAYASATDSERARRENATAYSIADRALNLPSALMLDEAQVERVCSALRAIVT
jgi:perosamine synthetase